MITEEASYAKALPTLEAAVVAGAGQEACFELCDCVAGDRKLLYPLNVGQVIYSGVFRWIAIKDALPLMRLSPVMTALDGLIGKHEILHRLPPLIQLHLQGDEFNRAVFLALNDVMNGIRLKLADKKFLASKDNLRRGANANYRSLMDMLAAAFLYRPTLLSVRVDCYYKRESSMSLLNVSAKECKEKADRFHRHRTDVLKRITRHCGRALVGYAWKKEFGRSRGLHLQLWILLDGEVYQDIRIGNQFGAMWLAETLAEGDFRNYNLGREKGMAVGLLDSADESKWEGLQDMAVYLTKPDTIMRLELGDGRRVFQSTPPKKRDKARGRPPKRRHAFDPFDNCRGDVHPDADLQGEN